MKVITAANQKGGAGKSTLTVILATALAIDYGYRVAVIDADPQQSITNIRANFDAHLLAQLKEADPETTLDYPYPIFALPLGEINDFIDDNADNYDVIFIDLPGRSDDAVLGDILAACEVVLVPMQATVVTKQATIDFMQIIQRIDEFCKKNEVPFSYFGISTARERNKKELEMDEFADSLGLPRFKNYIRRVQGYDPPSTLFSYSHEGFRSVVKADDKAYPEILAVCDELIERAELEKEEVSTNS